MNKALIILLVSSMLALTHFVKASPPFGEEKSGEVDFILKDASNTREHFIQYSEAPDDHIYPETITESKKAKRHVVVELGVPTYSTGSYYQPLSYGYNNGYSNGWNSYNNDNYNDGHHHHHHSHHRHHSHSHY